MCICTGCCNILRLLKDERYVMNELQDYIPHELKKQIIDIASENKICPVYRVDKSGTGELTFLSSTYEEFCNGGNFSEKYSKDDISTYSTSVYDAPDSCERYIKSMGRKVREKFPSPKIMVGSIQNGLSVHTFEYKMNYKDRTHIDWWIYKGQKEEAMKSFEEYVANEE